MISARRPGALLAAVAGAVLVAVLLAAVSQGRPATAHTARTYATKADCLPIPPGVKCVPGRGHQTPGGGSSVSHKGWPRIYGIRWQVIDNHSRGEHRVGTELNDELLGRGGSDRLAGGPGRDVLWGASNLQHNTARQHDTLRGGSGADWIYAGKGRNTITGGSGDDHIFVYNGHGTVDCGSGHDSVRTGRGHYTVRSCEHRSHA